MADETQQVNAGIKDINLIHAKLDELNPLIQPYKLAYVRAKEDCVPVERNAHYMDKEVFDRLTSNIEADGFLSQLPFGMKRKEDGKYIILSGNHRLKAAIKAKLEYILILYIEEVDEDTQLMYQLSHNSLIGKDDKQILQEIYNKIKNIEAREFSGLNDLSFIDVNKISTPSIGEGDIEITEMKFAYIESKSNSIKNTLAALEELDIDENTSVVVGKFEEFIKVMAAVKKQYDIKSRSVAFSKMVDICKAHLDELDAKKEETTNEEK